MIKLAATSPEGACITIDEAVFTEGSSQAPSWTAGQSVSLVWKGSLASGTNISNNILHAFGDHDARIVSDRIEVQNPGGTPLSHFNIAAGNIFPHASNVISSNQKYVHVIDIDASGGTGAYVLRSRIYTTARAAAAAGVASNQQTAGGDGLSTTSRLMMTLGGSGTTPGGNAPSPANQEISGFVAFRGLLTDQQIIDIFDDQSTEWWFNSTPLNASNSENLLAIIGFATTSGFATGNAGVDDFIRGYLEGVTADKSLTLDADQGSPSLLAVIPSVAGANGANFARYIDPATALFPETQDDILLTLDSAGQSAYFDVLAGRNQFLYDWLSDGGRGVDGDDRLAISGNSRGSRAISDQSGTAHGYELMQNYAHGVISAELAADRPIGGVGHLDFSRLVAGENGGPDFMLSPDPTTATTADRTALAEYSKYASGGQSRPHEGALILEDEIFALLAKKADVSTRMRQRALLLCLPGASASVSVSAVRATAAAGTAQAAAPLLSGSLGATYVMQSGGAAPTGGTSVSGDSGSTLIGVDLDTTVATLAAPSDNDDAAKTITLAAGLSGDQLPRPGQVIRLVGGVSDGYTNEIVSYDGATGVATLRHFWESGGLVPTSTSPRDVTDATAVLLGWYGFAVIDEEFDISGDQSHYGLQITNSAAGDVVLSYLECRDPSIAGPTLLPFGVGGLGYGLQIAYAHSDMWGVLAKAIGLRAFDVCSATQRETTPAANIRAIMDKILEYVPSIDLSLGHEPLSNAGDGSDGQNNNPFIRNGATLEYATGALDESLNQWRVHSGLAAERRLPFASPQLDMGSWHNHLPRAWRADAVHISVRGNERAWEIRRAALASAVQPFPRGGSGGRRFVSVDQMQAVLDLVYGEEDTTFDILS